jgi:LAS superfamily LD-carboxypeptidase LdcB
MRFKDLIATFLLIAIISTLWIVTLRPRIAAETVAPPPTPPEAVDKPVIVVSELSFASTTRVDEAGRHICKNLDSILVLVNKQRNLPGDYVPTDLVMPNVRFPFKEDQPRKYMREEAARALEALFAAALDDDITLYATSGYRSYETQKYLFDRKAAEVGAEEANKTLAYPGQSEHQTGLAMDITSARVGYKLLESFGLTPEGVWLQNNVHRFGYIIRYPEDKEHVTGYSYEPWHIRYVGLEVADYLYGQGLSLEEYFQQQYGY